MNNNSFEESLQDPEINNIQQGRRESDLPIEVTPENYTPETFKAVLEAYQQTLARNALLTERVKSLEDMANIDQMTGCFNRNYWEKLESELDKSDYHDHIAIIFCDANNFKSINDTYDHLVGDKVISMLGNVLKENFRAEDYIIRYGGDEFMVIYMSPDKEIDEDQLQVIKNKMDKIQTEFMQSIGDLISPDIPISVANGLAVFDSSDESIKSTIKRADRAMHVDKEASKNSLGNTDNTGHLNVGHEPDNS